MGRKKACDARAQRLHQTVVDAALRRVEIRMQADGGDAAADHADDLAALRVVVRHALERLKNERMVRNDELRADGDGLLDHLVRDVQCDQNRSDLASAGTDQHAHIVEIQLHIARNGLFKIIPDRCYVCHVNTS